MITSAKKSILFLVLAAFFLLCVRPAQASTPGLSTITNLQQAEAYCMRTYHYGTMGLYIDNGNGYPTYRCAGGQQFSVTQANVCPFNSSGDLVNGCTCNVGFILNGIIGNNSTTGNYCTVASQVVFDIAYQRAVVDGYSAAAATCAGGAASSAFTANAGDTSIVAAGGIAGRMTQSGAVCATAQAYAAAAVNPATADIAVNTHMVATPANCTLIAQARGAGFTGTFVSLTNRCIVAPSTGAASTAATGNGVFTVRLEPAETVQSPLDTPVLSVTEALMQSMSSAAAGGLAAVSPLMTSELALYVRNAAAFITQLTYVPAAGQAGMLAEQAAGNSDVAAQGYAGRAAAAATLNGSTPAQAVAAGAAASIASRAGMTSDQIYAAGVAAAAGTAVVGQAAPVVAAVNNVAANGSGGAGTSTTDYARQGEATTAANSIVTALTGTGTVPDSGSVTASVNGSNDSISNTINNITSDNSISWWAWTPPLSYSQCAPFTKIIFGKTITLDVCSGVTMIRDSLSWLFAMFAIWQLYGLALRKA